MLASPSTFPPRKAPVCAECLDSDPPTPPSPDPEGGDGLEYGSNLISASERI